MNEDLREDIWKLAAALNYASEAFASRPHDPDDDAMLSEAYEAFDAIKSRLGL